MDRPKWIKAEVFPYDSVEVEPLLQELERAKLIRRYENDGVKVVWCINFKKHHNIASLTPEEIFQVVETFKKEENLTEKKKTNNVLEKTKYKNSNSIYDTEES